MGKTEAMEALVSAGADVNATTRVGDTALHWACYRVGARRLLVVPLAAVLFAGGLALGPRTRQRRAAR